MGKKRRGRLKSQPLYILVAGIGFEPMTSGL